MDKAELTIRVSINSRYIDSDKIDRLKLLIKNRLKKALQLFDKDTCPIFVSIEVEEK